MMYAVTVELPRSVELTINADSVEAAETVADEFVATAFMNALHVFGDVVGDDDNLPPAFIEMKDEGQIDVGEIIIQEISNEQH